MEEIPIAAGLQIINAEAMQTGAVRYWRTTEASEQSIALINTALAQAHEPRR